MQVLSGDAVAVAAGCDHSMVLKQDGSVWATGRNDHGQLGDGTTSPKSSFVQVVSGGATAVAAGGQHSLVLKQYGSVWSTGSNSYGQLGSNLLVDGSAVFSKVIKSGVQAVAAGALHSVVVRRDGSVWTAGQNLYGQLGDGSTTAKSTFINVIATGVLTIGVQAVAAGASHSMILKYDGTVWVTGNNMNGQLGDRSIDDRSNFAVVYSGVKAIAGGFGHSMLLAEDDSVLTAGWNLYGQLGDGSITSTSSFVTVAQLSEGVVHDAAVSVTESTSPSNLPVITEAIATGGLHCIRSCCCFGCRPHVHRFNLMIFI